MNYWKIATIITIVILASVLVYFIGVDQGGTGLSLTTPKTAITEKNRTFMEMLSNGFSVEEIRTAIASNTKNVVMTDENKNLLKKVVTETIEANPTATHEEMTSEITLRLLAYLCCYYERPCCYAFGDEWL